MHGTILIYGNDRMLVTTRGLILEKAGYKVFTASEFADAMLLLINQRINVLLLCQSLTNEQRRGTIETAGSVRPDTKCAVLGFDGRELGLDGVNSFERLSGPADLLRVVEKLQTATM